MRLYKTTNEFHQDCVVQFQYGSNNSKVGDSVQIWVLPLKWITDGKGQMEDDSASCLDCIHSKRANRTCYVRKGMSEMGLKSKVNSLHKAYHDGKVELLPMEDATAELPKIQGKFVRFGAYGEPIFLGETIVKAVTESASNWTGYTHQWRNPKYQWASRYFMASADTERLGEVAQGMGWRTFRVRSKADPIIVGEINCPASKEMGNRVQCNACGLCKGTSTKAKSITIIKH
jgi:hypothetical protein